MQSLKHQMESWLICKADHLEIPFLVPRQMKSLLPHRRFPYDSPTPIFRGPTGGNNSTTVITSILSGSVSPVLFGAWPLSSSYCNVAAQLLVSPCIALAIRFSDMLFKLKEFKTKFQNLAISILVYFLPWFMIVPLLKFAPLSTALGDWYLLFVKVFIRTIFCSSLLKIALCDI